MKNRNVFIGFLALGAILGWYLVRLAKSSVPPASQIDAILK